MCSVFVLESWKKTWPVISGVSKLELCTSPSYELEWPRLINLATFSSSPVPSLVWVRFNNTAYFVMFFCSFSLFSALCSPCTLYVFCSLYTGWWFSHFVQVSHWFRIGLPREIVKFYTGHDGWYRYEIVYWFKGHYEWKLLNSNTSYINRFC